LNLPVALRARNQRVPGIFRMIGTASGMSVTVVDTARPIAMASNAATMICTADPGVLKESQSCWYQLRLTNGSPVVVDGSLEPSRESGVVLVPALPLTSMSPLLRGESAGVICSTAMLADDVVTTRGQVTRDATPIAKKEQLCTPLLSQVGLQARILVALFGWPA
jgi:hypothetical protein